MQNPAGKLEVSWSGTGRGARRLPAGSRLGVVLVALLGASVAQAQLSPQGGSVHGSLYTRAGSAQTQIFVPDVGVTLRDPNTNAIKASSRTDLTGHFAFNRQPAGTYKLCWAANGFVASCSPTQVSVVGKPVYLPAQSISTTGTTLSGTVKLKDGSPCFGVDPFFNLNLFTRVQVLSPAGSQLVPQVRANSVGQYVVGAVPSVATGTPILRTLCEALTTNTSIGSIHLSGTPLHVTLNNTPPRLDAAFARLAGVGVRTVNTGATVDAQADAVDPDGDSLNYLWRVETHSGVAGAANASVVPWTLPSRAGRPSLYVLVSDGKGGYRKGRVTLTAGTGGAEFSGRVLNSFSRAAVVGATVSVNGVRTATTDSAGKFFIRNVPFAGRYVVNVTRQGFAEFSRVYDESSTGGTYLLIPSQGRILDPRLTMDFTDTREELRRRQMLGARIVLPPGTLDSSNPVIASIATLVPALEPMTGDYEAVDREGRSQTLVSFGAVFVEFRDQATGRLVNVAPGKQATVMLPLQPHQRESAPTSIPLWSYDMRNGRWVEEGLATLQSVEGQPMYVGTTTHFSTINADLAFGASANCLRVRVDPLKLPPGLTLRVEVPTGSGTQVFDVNLNSDQFHGLFRLPQSSTVTLTLLDTLGNPVPGGSTAVNMSLRPQLPGSGNYPLTYPYTECGVPIDLGLSMPAYAEHSQGNPVFLTGPYGFYLPPASVPDPADVTEQYYFGIDPNFLRETLGEFWQQNGFDPLTGAGGTRAAYLNHNDLGLGRDMHCLKDNVTNNLACYVTNYGQPDQNPTNSDKALTANVADRVATVAMEFSPIEGAVFPNTNTKVVKFYVYTGGDATSPRRPDAVLDAFGPKYVPYLCLVCHGGFYQPVDPLNPTYDELRLGATDFDPGAGAVFREFDLESFRYPPGGATYPPTVPTGQGSLTDFRDLNIMVRDTLPTGHAVRNLIETWYPGVSVTPDLTTPVPGWGPAASPQDGLYKNVVAPSCRTCHAARAGMDFGSYATFHPLRSSIQAVVCGDSNPANNTTRRMPNAVVTYKNFWESLPSRPGYLGSYADPVVGWTAYGSCP